jgi:hypothetical protein
MIERQDIIIEIEKELSDLLTDAPANLSESALKSIKAESIGHAEHVLNALTTQKLQSAGPFNRFVEEHAGARSDEDALAVMPISGPGRSVGAGAPNEDGGGDVDLMTCRKT